MCGLAGVVFFENRDPRYIAGLMELMNDAQVWRGPDGAGVWSDARVGLGHVRLALVGDHERGRAPMVDEAGARLVFNGELYRPAGVMASLGLPFPDGECDARAFHALLRREGPAGLARVEGQFAAARYEPDRGTLLLVRDAWGEKPLLICRRPEGVYFASTHAALRSVLGARPVRTGALHEYLVYRSVGGFRTAFEGVEQLPPGSWLEITLDGTESRGNWFQCPEPTRMDPAPDEIRHEFERAVEGCLDARLHQAVFLSGGLDSSLVAAVAARRLAAHPPRFFSVGYDIRTIHDEREQAHRMVRDLGAECTELEVSAAAVPELLTATARALEDPIQDPVTLATMVLVRAAVKETRCVLTGDGSDEFWGGYERFANAPARIDDYLPRTSIFHPSELGLTSPPLTYYDQLLPAPAGWEPLDRCMDFETRNRMRNYHLARMDKIGMSCGLEIRAPFLDRRLTSLAKSIPAHIKRPADIPKGLLISACRGHAPEWLLNRTKKPFTVPIREWLAGPLKEYARDRLTPNARTSSLVQAQPYFENLTEGHAARLWSLLALEAWMEEFA